MRWRIGVLLIALLVFLAVAGGVLSAPRPSPAVAAGSCSDVTFIGVRGSGEKNEASTRGMGRSVNYLASKLNGLVSGNGESLGFDHVEYTAADTAILVPSTTEINFLGHLGGPAAVAAAYYARHLRPYLDSIEDGVKRTITKVQQTHARCPETEMVLAGYSQGAIVVHQAELRLEKAGDEAVDYVGGTLLLGDGDRVRDTSAPIVGGASRAGSGIRIGLPLVSGLLRPQDVAEPETTVEVCAPHDIVCDFSLMALVKAGRDGFLKANTVHESYFFDRRKLLDKAVVLVALEIGLS